MIKKLEDLPQSILSQLTKKDQNTLKNMIEVAHHRGLTIMLNDEGTDLVISKNGTVLSTKSLNLTQGIQQLGEQLFPKGDH